MKTAIITGGARGIGFGIAQCMARDGYDLVLGYHTNHSAAQLAQDTIKKEYRVKLVCCSGDVAFSNMMEKLFDTIRTHFNNELTAFKRGIDLSLTCKGLRHIIAISSPGCNSNQAPRVQYEMPGQAKASMEFLVRLYARTLAKQNINVNCIIPGYIKTDAWENLFTKIKLPREVIETNVQSIPMERWSQPTDIGEMVAFLCSSRGEFITDVALPVDGGLHLQG